MSAPLPWYIQATLLRNVPRLRRPLPIAIVVQFYWTCPMLACAVPLRWALFPHQEPMALETYSSFASWARSASETLYASSVLQYRREHSVLDALPNNRPRLQGFAEPLKPVT